VTGRPVLVATHLLAEFSTRAEDLLVAARKVRAREGEEAVHDLRVATRRLSDILSLWRAALERRPARRARRALDRLRRALGAVREHEVHADMLAKLLDGGPPELASAGRSLQSRLEARLEKDRARAALAADAAEVARILARVERATAGVAARLAADPALIEQALGRAARREERARAAIAALPQGAGDGSLHKARIEAKKARYTLECMNAIGVRRDKEGERAFRKAQRDLGTAHDWATLSAWIEKERARRLRHVVAAASDFALTHEDESIAALAARVSELEKESRDGFRPPEGLAGA
jgi:CHAD domain-containing protein